MEIAFYWLQFSHFSISFLSAIDRHSITLDGTNPTLSFFDEKKVGGWMKSSFSFSSAFPVSAIRCEFNKARVALNTQKLFVENMETKISSIKAACTHFTRLDSTDLLYVTLNYVLFPFRFNVSCFYRLMFTFNLGFWQKENKKVRSLLLDESPNWF